MLNQDHLERATGNRDIQSIDDRKAKHASVSLAKLRACIRLTRSNVEIAGPYFLRYRVFLIGRL